ncbi:MAG: 50S ribosomal protein L16 [Patescibacteria group bacterium]
MQAPKRIPHRKVHNKRSRKGLASRGTFVAFGEYGLKATESGWLTARQIEAARRSISRRSKGGKVFIRVFADQPVTNHGSESVMGSGAGSLDYFMTPVRPGQVIFEVSGIAEDIVSEGFRIAGHKLPFKTKMVHKRAL